MLMQNLPLYYLCAGLLWVTSMMLVLFFVGGVYSDRISSASKCVHTNRFVPQVNRSLRIFNMHLVMNTSSRWPWSSSQSTYLRNGAPVNPRGEMIFSARVQADFRQGYERYRNAYEQKRQEKLQAQQRAKNEKRPWFMSLLAQDTHKKTH